MAIFYGDSHPAGMYFDRVYPNYTVLKDTATEDNVYLGRYILVDYDQTPNDENGIPDALKQANNFLKNLYLDNKENENLKDVEDIETALKTLDISSLQIYDSTIWQKALLDIQTDSNENVDETQQQKALAYIQVARLDGTNNLSIDNNSDDPVSLSMTIGSGENEKIKSLRAQHNESALSNVENVKNPLVEVALSEEIKGIEEIPVFGFDAYGHASDKYSINPANLIITTKDGDNITREALGTSLANIKTTLNGAVEGAAVAAEFVKILDAYGKDTDAAAKAVEDFGETLANKETQQKLTTDLNNAEQKLQSCTKSLEGFEKTFSEKPLRINYLDVDENGNSFIKDSSDIGGVLTREDPAEIASLKEDIEILKSIVSTLVQS